MSFSSNWNQPRPKVKVGATLDVTVVPTISVQIPVAPKVKGKSSPVNVFKKIGKTKNKTYYCYRNTDVVNHSSCFEILYSCVWNGVSAMLLLKTFLENAVLVYIYAENYRQ